MNDTEALPDFTILRKFAEAASGVRGGGSHDPVWLVYDPEPPEHYRPYRGRVRVARSEPGPGDKSSKAVAIQVSSRTTHDQPALPDLARIGLGDRTVNLLALNDQPGVGGNVAADAVFWTESAVEKFVVPYYASVHGPGAARKVEAVLRVLHGRAEGGRSGGDAGGTDPVGANFALVHLPTSEYVEDPLATGGEERRADEFYIARVEPSQARAVLVSLDAWVERELAKEG